MSDYKIWTHKEQFIYKDYSFYPIICDEDVWWWFDPFDEDCEEKCLFAYMHEVLEKIDNIEESL